MTVTIMWTCDVCGEYAKNHSRTGRCLFIPEGKFKATITGRLFNWTDAERLQRFYDTGDDSYLRIWNK